MTCWPQGHKVATLGPLIHNPQVVEDLEAKGALTCPDVASVPDGYEVIIRSHGVPQNGLRRNKHTPPGVSRRHLPVCGKNP